MAGCSYSSTFYDITSGNNDYTPSGYTGGLYPAGTGYDMASGLGSPIGSALPAELCGSAVNTVTVTNPGKQKTVEGSSVSLQINATDSASGQTLTFSATGLPKGLSINAGSGLVTGSPTKVSKKTVTVTATDTTGATGSATFIWKIKA